MRGKKTKEVVRSDHQDKNTAQIPNCSQQMAYKTNEKKKHRVADVGIVVFTTFYMYLYGCKM